MNLTNFVIERARRGTMFSTTTGEAMWSITQIEDPSLNVTSEQREAVDALGAKIMEFDRAKNAEFSGSNSMFDMNLAAAQFGREKEVASESNKLTIPKWEEVTLTEEMITAKKITLEEVPVGTAGAEIPFIYTLNGDGSLNTKYAIGAAASATQFALTAITKELTLPTGLVKGDRLWIPYDFAATEAVAVSNTAVDFPRAGRFVMEVLGSDVCDPTKKYYAYIEFPNAKLKADVELTFTTDGKHPFTIQAMQQYCDTEKRLFSIKIPEVATLAS